MPAQSAVCEGTTMAAIACAGIADHHSSGVHNIYVSSVDCGKHSASCGLAV